MVSWQDTYKDNGATKYWHFIPPCSHLATPRDLGELTHNFGHNSAKIAFLCHMVHHICRVNHRKVIVFTEWPYTQWLPEQFLQNLGFRFLVIRAKHSLRECNDLVDTFNNKGSEVHVLVTSSPLGNLILNMQYDCSDVIFLVSWSDALNALQCSGRVLRLGQTRIYHIYTITLNHAYDQVIHASACLKMLSIMGAQCALGITAEDIQKWRDEHEVGLHEKLIKACLIGNVT